MSALYSIFKLTSLYTEVLVAQPCPTLCDPMNCSPPGSSVHGIFQARILEWVAIFYSQARDQTRVSCIAESLHLSHQGSPGLIVTTILGMK